MTNDQNLGQSSPLAGLASKIRGGKSAAASEFENRPPLLIVSRGADGDPRGGGLFVNLFLTFRNLIANSVYTVNVDDVAVGSLMPGSKLKVEVATGTRRVQIITRWAKSKSFKHEFSNGDSLILHCRTKLFGIVLYQP